MREDNLRVERWTSFGMHGFWGAWLQSGLAWLQDRCCVVQMTARGHHFLPAAHDGVAYVPATIPDASPLAG